MAMWIYMLAWLLLDGVSIHLYNTKRFCLFVNITEKWMPRKRYLLRNISAKNWKRIRGWRTVRVEGSGPSKSLDPSKPSSQVTLLRKQTDLAVGSDVNSGHQTIHAASNPA